MACAMREWMSKMLVMKVHAVLQAPESLRVQKERLKTYVGIGKQEQGKPVTKRMCISDEAVCGNTVYTGVSRGRVP